MTNTGVGVEHVVVVAVVEHSPHFLSIKTNISQIILEISYQQMVTVKEVGTIGGAWRRGTRSEAAKRNIDQDLYSEDVP